MARIAVSALEGAELNVEMTGRGPALAALHGFTGSVQTWQSFSEAAGTGLTVVAVDLPGHGASDSPPDFRMYTMERHVQALIEILDRLGLERVAWLGYSLGGRIALSAAVALPERTTALVLESASPGIASEEERQQRIREDETLADWIEDVGVQRFVEYWELLPLWNSQKRLPAALRDRLRSQRLGNNPCGLANSLRGVGTGAQPPLHDRLGEITAPALLVAGEEDEKFSGIAREMHRSIPTSRLETVADGGTRRPPGTARNPQSLGDWISARSPHCGGFAVMEPATPMPYLSRRLPSTDTPSPMPAGVITLPLQGRDAAESRSLCSSDAVASPWAKGCADQRSRQVDACRQANPAFQGRGHDQSFASILRQAHQLQRLVQSAQPTRLDHQYVRAIHRCQALRLCPMTPSASSTATGIATERRNLARAVESLPLSGSSTYSMSYCSSLRSTASGFSAGPTSGWRLYAL